MILTMIHSSVYLQLTLEQVTALDNSAGTHTPRRFLIPLPCPDNLIILISSSLR
jgi:hypothetical protein